MKNLSTRTKWINSAGGPLLLLPMGQLESWNGFEQVDAGKCPDYDRACEIQEFLGVVSVGQGKGIVLGGEPMETAWLPFIEKSGGTLIRWIYANDEASVDSHLKCIPDDIFGEPGVLYDVDERKLCLFD